MNLLLSICLSTLQTVCFASGTNETAHTAKVVARQRSSKKTGRPYLVNTQMRVKPAAPLVLNGKILDHHFHQVFISSFSYAAIFIRLSKKIMINSSMCIIIYIKHSNL